MATLEPNSTRTYPSELSRNKVANHLVPTISVVCDTLAAYLILLLSTVDYRLDYLCALCF